MSRRGSLLIQALMLLTLFAASLIGFLSLRSGSLMDRRIASDFRSANTARTANGSILVACDRYLKGRNLDRTMATQLKGLNRDFPEDPHLTVLAQFAPDAPYEDGVPTPLVINSQIAPDGPRFLAHVTVYGERITVDGREKLRVTDCTVSPYERAYRDAVQTTWSTTSYFESVGIPAYAYLGRCLKSSYDNYALQSSFSVYDATATTFNLCGGFEREIRDPASSLTNLQKQTISDYCGHKLVAALGAVPEPWARNLGACLAQSGRQCTPPTGGCQ